VGALNAGRIEAHNEAQRRYFEENEKRRMRPSGSPYVERQVDELVRFAGLHPGERVLDVGCGMGRYTLPLAERGLRVEGLDLTPALLDRLRAFAGGRYDIPLHAVDVVDPPGELLGAFDAVVGFFTLHHLHDLDASFASMARLVAPGGRIAFLEPNPYNPLYYVQIAATPGQTWEGDGGLVRMRRSVVFGAMEKAGLRGFRLERFGFFPPFVANRPAARPVERALERVRPLGPVLPFQLFGAARPDEPAAA
jgi:SAM-dependent methyltransferase